MAKKLNVLSLFDGISCGQVAINKIGVPINKYFASEIDVNAIKVTQDNYPDTIQLGSVEFVTKGMINHEIDVLMGGSPCQGFSFSGKQLNFEDPRSRLFFEFVRLKEELKPKYWLLENVVMKKEYQDVISKHLGVEPVKLNSALTSAQNRVRLYWANFKIEEPKGQGIKLVDVLEDPVMMSPAAIRGRRLSLDAPITQCLEVKSINTDKSNCLTTVAKDTVLTSMPIGRHLGAFKNKLPYRNYTAVERCRLMNLPDDYCKSISLNQTVKATGNGWDVGMIAHILKGIN